MYICTTMVAGIPHEDDHDQYSIKYSLCYADGCWNGTNSMHMKRSSASYSSDKRKYVCGAPTLGTVLPSYIL